MAKKGSTQITADDDRRCTQISRTDPIHCGSIMRWRVGRTSHRDSDFGCGPKAALREFLAVITPPLAGAAPTPLPDAIKTCQCLVEQFEVLEDGPQVWRHLVDLSRSASFGGRQVHDANIVATMLAHGEDRLLTFNDGDFRRFATVIAIVVP